MAKFIPFVLLSLVAAMIILLSGCDNKVTEESSTSVNDSIIETVEKSSPITKGNLITKTATDDDGNLNVNYFDSENNLVESYVWNDDEFVSHNIMIYGDNNLIQKKETLDSEGKALKVENYSYDTTDKLSQVIVNSYENNKLIKTENFDSNGSVIGYSKTFYNDNAVLEKIERYDKDDNLVEYYTYQYNDAGHTSKYSSYDSNDKLIRYTTFEYENNVLVKESYFDGEDNLQTYYIIDYNEDGTKFSSTCYDSTGNIISTDYF